MKLEGGFKFYTSGSYPVPVDGKIIQYTRYQKGNLITVSASDIERIEPHKKYRGGRIFFKNEAEDQFYMIWPLEIICRK